VDISLSTASALASIFCIEAVPNHSPSVYTGIPAASTMQRISINDVLYLAIQ